MERPAKIALAAGLGALAGLVASTLLVGDAEAAEGTPEDKDLPDLATATGTLRATVGKGWVLTNKLLDAQDNWTGKAANYGWQYKGPKFDGKTWEPSVSSQTQRVIQGIGTRHNEKHADYSQTIVLVSNTCLYKGEPRRFADLIQSPETASLLSAEGPLKLTRQPGVPYLEANVQPSETRVTRDQVLMLPSPTGNLSPQAYGDALAQREAQILSWVEQGMAEYEMVPIQIDDDLVVSVFSDALKFGGVRVCATAYLEQQVADRLDCSLLTAKLSDIIYAAATQVLQPIPLGGGPNMASTPMMVKESDLIDAAIAKLAA